MKRFQYALAAAIVLFAVGCDPKEPKNQTSDEDANVSFKQDIVLTTNVEFVEDHYDLGAITASGDNGDLGVTLCIKGSTFVDGTYSAKCETGESEVWGFLYDMNDYEASYTIDSVSATVKNYSDEGRIEITAKYYTPSRDSLYVIHFGQKIAPVESRTINITNASFYDFTKNGSYISVTNGNDSTLQHGDFYFMFSCYSSQIPGSYTVSDIVSMASAFGYIDNLEDGTLLNALSVLYGTIEVRGTEEEGYTAVAKVMASDSVFYTINISGNYVENGYSVDASDDIEYTFDAAKTTAYYTYYTYEGTNYATYQITDGTYYLQFIAFFEGDKDTVTIVPANYYAIGSYYQAGTVANGYYDSETKVIGNSFFSGISDGNLTSPVYCLVDGSVVIANVDGKCSITVDGTNSKYASVKLSYTGKVTAAPTTSSNAPAKNIGKTSTTFKAAPSLFSRH